jgi:hypothetical protein
MTVNLSSGRNVGGRWSLGDCRGQYGERQQSEQSGPKRNRAFHVLLLGSFGGNQSACSIEKIVNSLQHQRNLNLLIRLDALAVDCRIASGPRR